MIELNNEELKAIASFKRLEKKWPSSLWLLTNGQSLSIMKIGIDGKPAMTEDGDYDQDYIVDTVNIHSDGFI